MKKKKLKEGFTTGACAAAAAKIAVLNLISDEEIKTAEVWFPEDKYFKFNAFSLEKNTNEAEVIIKKFAGDDPDITDGALIGAKVKFIDGKEIKIKGGSGVGYVTKKGLAVEPGEPAINPVPRLMIEKNVREVVQDRGVEVEIFVVDGEKLAQKTLNKKLGIIGGISILGTTGIVKPISDEAYKATIDVELNVAKALNLHEIVFVTGRTTEKIAKTFLKLENDAFVTIGDHIGFALENAVKKNFLKVHFVGQFGKFTKVASGEFQTHVKNSQIFISNLINFLDVEEKDEEFVRIIENSISARNVFEEAKNRGLKKLFFNVTKKVAENCFNYVNGKIDIVSYLVGYHGKVFAKYEIKN